MRYGALDGRYNGILNVRVSCVDASHHLFISYVQPHGPISKDRLSKWLVEVIKLDPTALTVGSTPKAHDVHALVISWALVK